MLKQKWLILLACLFMVACTAAPEETGSEEVAEIVETAVPEPTETAVPPPTNTAEPTPTNTPEPTPLPTDTPAPTNTPEPTATPTIAPTPTIAFTTPRFSVADRFTIYGEQPAVPRGSDQFTDPGAVVFHDGQFHMFHNAFTGWPASVDYLYSVSDDGINWTLVQEEPVFNGDDLDYVGFTTLASSALVREDGTWMLYFYIWDERTWPAASGSIGVATATNPLGPWTASNAPILQPGASSEWDGDSLRAPSVVATEDGYVMYYAGYSGNSSAIGRATSSDGLTWTKYDDSATSAAPFAASDPVFGGAPEGWDRFNVSQPRVVMTAEGLVMLYVGATNASRSPINNNFGLAVSADGMEWTRTDDVIFTGRDVRSGGQNMWFAELAYAEGTYFAYVELGRGNNTEIYVATIEEPLLNK
ncbi:MAG: hypothetical protein AAF614_02210 [Chloroflexota bacterium]